MLYDFSKMSIRDFHGKELVSNDGLNAYQLLASFIFHNTRDLSMVLPAEAIKQGIAVDLTDSQISGVRSQVEESQLPAFVRKAIVDFIDETKRATEEKQKSEIEASLKAKGVNK